MSQEDLQALADIIQKPAAKTENRKILVILFVGLLPSVMIGIDLGDWHAWRGETERRVTKIENILSSPQAIANEQRAIYNKNIKVR